MYILVVNYSQVPELVAPHKDGHSAWVRKNFDEGVFLLSGPKKNKLGGAILAHAIEKERLMQIIANDPFVKADVADYQIVEIDCKSTANGLEMLAGC